MLHAYGAQSYAVDCDLYDEIGSGQHRGAQTYAVGTDMLYVVCLLYMYARIYM